MSILYPKPTVVLWTIYVAVGNPELTTIFRAVHIPSINPMTGIHIADSLFVYFADDKNQPTITHLSPRLTAGLGVPEQFPRCANTTPKRRQHELFVRSRVDPEWANRIPSAPPALRLTVGPSQWAAQAGCCDS